MLMISHIYDGIYLSGNYALDYADEVRKLGIQAVLRLDHLSPLFGSGRQWDEDFALLYLPFSDGEPIPPLYITQATHFIHRHLERERKVLVHCQMGVSRSVTMVLAYLIEHANMSLPRAFALVRAQHPIAFPHPALLCSLVEHYNLPYSKDQIYSLGFLDDLMDASRARSG